MLRLVTYYTPSHAAMCRRFVLSRAWGFYERRPSRFEQTCPTGAFKSDGWNVCMLDKLRCLLSLPCDGMPTVYVDSDVALLRGFHDWCESVFAELPGSAVAFADDVVQWCAGVMLFRSTPAVHEFWRLLASLSPIWNLPDQDIIHQLRQQVTQTGGQLPILPRVLPPDRVCNWATVNAPTLPQPWDGEAFVVPQSCVAWHANWTIGVDRKMQMLERVVLHGGQYEPD
jgi:hypothetical protein